MQSRRGHALRVSLCVLAALASCKAKSKQAAPEAATPGASDASATHSQREALLLTQVLLEEGAGTHPELVDTEQLARELGAGLVAQAPIHARPEDVPADARARRIEARLRISHRIEREPAPRVVVALEGELASVDGGNWLAPRRAILVERENPELVGEAATAALGELLLSAVQAMATGLAEQESLRVASDGELLNRLERGISDETLLAWALRVAAERKLAGVIPFAVAALAHDDDEVEGAALSTLVALRAQEAVPVLTKDVDFKDHDRMSLVLEAVAAIGGEEAEAFVDFVASGHTDNDLKTRAKVLQGEMRGN